jgi:hypothetical protein
MTFKLSYMTFAPTTKESILPKIENIMKLLMRSTI